MGVFDYVKFEYPLPDPERQDWEWQSKDTPAQYMEFYRVTKDGLLIHEAVHYEAVPEEERPYWNTPEWEMPLMQFVGSIRTVSDGDEVVDYHGDIIVVGGQKGHYEQIVQYRCRFTNGRLEWIREIREE